MTRIAAPLAATVVIVRRKRTSMSTLLFLPPECHLHHTLAAVNDPLQTFHADSSCDPAPVRIDVDPRDQALGFKTAESLIAPGQRRTPSQRP